MRSDSEVRRLWAEYRGTFAETASKAYYRVLRVLIGLDSGLCSTVVLRGSRSAMTGKQKKSKQL